MMSCALDVCNHDLEALCAAHLRREETLLNKALLLARRVKDACVRSPVVNSADALMSALANHVELAGLMDELAGRRIVFRAALASHLGVAAEKATISHALAHLGGAAREALAADKERLRRLADELATVNSWLGIHVRIHLEAYRRILLDLTSTTSGSGRYGPGGDKETLQYRPLLQLNG